MSSAFHRLLRLLGPISVGLLLASGAGASGFTIIANKDVPVDSLSRTEVQAIFLGEKVKWDKAFYIKVVVPEEESVLKDFLKTLLGKTPSQFDNHWAKLTFTGRAVPPQSFGDISKLVAYVAGNRGAVSVVPSGAAGSTVKTISVR